MKAMFAEVRLVLSGLRALARPSLRRVVCRLEKNHFVKNPVASAYAYGRLRRTVRWLASHPKFSTLVILFVYVAVACASRYVEPSWLGVKAPASVADLFRDFFNINANILAAQATLVGLVFPLVIALVGLFYEARTAVAGRLTIYFQETEARAVGGSCLLLCVAQISQLPLATQLPLRTLGALALLNCAWFAVNVCGLMFFLFRSLEYIQPETRSVLFSRFIANVAWRREMSDLLAQSHQVNAVAFGHLPTDRSQTDEEIDEDDLVTRRSPQVSPVSFFDFEGPSESVFIGKEKILADVRLPLLSLVANRWLTDAKRVGGVRAAVAPRLMFMPYIGKRYSGRVELVRWTDGYP